MAREKDLMIWSEDGVWLQTVDGDGRVRSSFCGRLSRTSVENFCHEHGLAFAVHGSAGRATAARGPSTGAQARLVPCRG